MIRSRTRDAVAEPDPARLEVEARIRQRVLDALSGNRAPGYHFPGHFLDLQCQRFERDGVRFLLPAGPHCLDPDGQVDIHALALLADMTLASANRRFVPSSARTATLSLQMDFTGVAARGDLLCTAHSDGFSPHTTLPQAHCAGELRSVDALVARLTGKWVAPPAPGGAALAPLPWERGEPVTLPTLRPNALEAAEKRVLRHAEACLVASRDGTSFLHHFWSQEAHHTSTGSRGTLPLGMHTCNRVNHVQGGLLIGFATACARAAVPHHPVLSAVSCWFISPGIGRALTARSQVLQHGRNVAVVRTQVFGAGRRRVLEATSTHALAARRH